MSNANKIQTDLTPLVPILQSPCLYIHLTTVSLSQGILGISFVAGLIYLIKQIDQKKRNKKNIWLELVLFSLIACVGFIRSEEHTSELQSRGHLVCRLLLEKKNIILST